MRFTKHSINKVFLVAYFFLAVFLPDFCAIRARDMVIAINIFYIVYYGLIHNKLVFDLSLLKMLSGFLPFVFYFLISTGLRYILDSTNREAYLSNLNGNIINIIYICAMMMAVYLVCKQCGLSYPEVIDIIIIVTIIQLGLVILSYIFPQVYDYFTSLTFRYSHDEQVRNATERYYLLRSYGFAGNLFDSFGYVTSLLTILIFIKGISENKKSILFLALACLIMPALNTRTGLLLSVLGFIIVLIFFYKPKKLIQYTLVMLLAVLALFIVYQRMPEYTRASISLGFREILYFFQGDKSISVLNALLVDDIVYPTDIFWGQSASPEFFGYSGIDSGYIQFIWRYGLIGFILYIMGLLFMCNFLFRRAKLQQEQKCYIIVYVMFFFVYLFKMFSLFNYGAITITFGLFSTFIASKNDNYIID